MRLMDIIPSHRSWNVERTKPNTLSFFTSITTKATVAATQRTVTTLSVTVNFENRLSKLVPVRSKNVANMRRWVTSVSNVTISMNSASTMRSVTTVPSDLANEVPS